MPTINEPGPRASESRAVRLLRPVLTYGGVAVFTALVAPLAVCTAWPIRYVVVQNASGDEVRSVEIIVRNENGPGIIQCSRPRLAPGGRVVIRHGWNDSGLDITLVVGGNRRRYAVPYLDLWYGEGWRVEVRPGGIIVSGRNHEGASLD